MTPKQALAKLKSLGDEKVRDMNTRYGAAGEQFGVKLGDIRKVAKEIKTDHALGLKLWETGNVDARFLALLLIKPKELSIEQLDQMVRDDRFTRIADWLNAYVVKKHPESESKRQEWMDSDDPMAARAGWNLTSIRVSNAPDDLDLDALLDRIEAEMADAPPESQWTMNNTLAEIGINSPKHRKRALAIGESLGIYRDYPVSKGCTSPFAPIWINEMVSRQS